MELTQFKNKIKLIALDLDGTALTSEKKVSQGTLDALHHAHECGIKTVIVSGRPPQGIVEHALTMKLTKDDFFICFNGSGLCKLDQYFGENKLHIYSTQFKPFFCVTTPYSCFRPIFNKLHSLGLNVHAFSTTRCLLVENDNPGSNREATNSHLDKTYVDFAQIDDNEHFYKFNVVGNPRLLDKLRAELTASDIKYYDVVRSEDTFLEFISQKYNKGIMLAKLCELLNITTKEVVAFGDAENDLSMIKTAGLGVAMGNSMELLKEQADFITNTNDEDGIAFVLNQII